MSVNNPTVLSATVARTGAGTLAVTGLAVGWTVHLAFFLVTLGLTLVALCSAVGVHRQTLVIDDRGRPVPVPSSRSQSTQHSRRR